jgi:hypothetical protein
LSHRSFRQGADELRSPHPTQRDTKGAFIFRKVSYFIYIFNPPASLQAVPFGSYYILFTMKTSTLAVASAGTIITGLLGKDQPEIAH